MRLGTCKIRLFFVAVTILTACSNQSENKSLLAYPYQAVGLTMGTTYHIKASQLPDSLTSDEINHQVSELLDKVSGQMSTYQTDSELSLFNRTTATDWLPVSTALYGVLREAIKISQLSNGLFDVTVGPLVNLWGFGPDEPTVKIPDDVAVKNRLKFIGYNHIKLKGDGLYIKKDIPELYVDLSGIAKGYGVDQVALLLERLGIVNYMVEIGGEIRVKGKNSQSESWQIGVEKPTEEQGAIEKVLSITDTGMATSGDYRHYFEVDGLRFSHTIDPRTGKPIKHKLASVTVLRETSMEADALATAVMVLGPDEGYQFVEKNHISAFFIVKTDNGFDELMSTAFVNRTEVAR